MRLWNHFLATGLAATTLALGASAQFVNFGSGCAGTIGVPTLSAAPGSTPTAGGTFTLCVANAPGLTYLMVGFDHHPNGIPLGLIGMPGCSLYIRTQAAVLSANPVGGTACFSLALPNHLVGASLYFQGFCIDPGANPLGLTATAGGHATTLEDSFSIVVLPDTQYYSKYYPATYLAQTSWIVAQRANRNIEFVTHVGDLTHDNTDPEWSNASAAHSILDGVVPYSITPGNHDIERPVHTRDYTKLSSYFPPARFVGSGGFLEGSQNNYTTFSHRALDFLVLSLEIAPRKDVLQWANGVVRQHPTHRVIVVTHAYQLADGSYDLDSDGSASNGYYNLIGADGEELWDEFVSRHSNIFMVLSGHRNGSIHRSRGDTSHGNVVHEVLTDFQFEGGQNGNGWLRVLTFTPRLGTVRSEVLSVLPGITTLDRVGDYPPDPSHPQHAFHFNYDMTSPIAADAWDDSNARFGDRTVQSVLTVQQTAPEVAVDANGNHVVVWVDGNDIWVRGFYKGGWHRFSTIVNWPGGRHKSPAVAMDGVGNFVVVWENDANSDGSYDISAKWFWASGTPRYERTANVTTSGQQLRPDVAADADGDFVVVWQDDNDGNGLFQIYARGFFQDGSQRFPVRTVNSVAAGQQFQPDIGMDDDGDFVVAWEDDQDRNGFYDILARWFWASGNPRYEVRVNSTTSGQQVRPDVAADGDGDFVVTWQDDSNTNRIYEIKARGFHADGTERFHDFTVNTVSSGQQLVPTLAMDQAGRFVVAWQDDANENFIYQIKARGFHASGSQRIAELTVNGNEDGQQFVPSVAMAATGDWLVAWQDDLDQDGTMQVLARGLSN